MQYTHIWSEIIKTYESLLWRTQSGKRRTPIYIVLFVHWKLNHHNKKIKINKYNKPNQNSLPFQKSKEMENVDECVVLDILLIWATINMNLSHGISPNTNGKKKVSPLYLENKKLKKRKESKSSLFRKNIHKKNKNIKST